MQDFIPFSNFKKIYHSFNITESFDENNYLFPEQEPIITGNVIVQNEKIITGNKFKEINNSIKDNISLNDTVNQNYLVLNNKIKDYQNLNKTVLKYDEKKITLADGLKEDINTMLVYENNMYIFSTVTLALLLVGIIVVAKE